MMTMLAKVRISTAAMNQSSNLMMMTISMKKTKKTRKVWTGTNSSCRQEEKIGKKDTRIQMTR